MYHAGPRMGPSATAGETAGRGAGYAGLRTDYNGNCYISHSACEEDARQVAELVEARFPKLRGRVEIFSIGPTIGSHTGPGTVALFFWGSPRTD